MVKGHLLGIEGGGTKTTWVLLDSSSQIVAQGQAGPGNIALLNDRALERLLREIRRQAGANVQIIGGAFAGYMDTEDEGRVEKSVRCVWPKAETVRVMEDTRSLLVAAFDDCPGIGVIAGTGSNVAGQKSAHEPMEKAICWGHLVADHGSSYDLARRGLKRAFEHYDQRQKISVLAREYLSATGTDSMEELVLFTLRDLSKAAVAQWAKYVFSAAKKGDRDASKLLDDASADLAAGVAIVARRFRFKHFRVALTGGLFENQPGYRASFERALRRLCPGAKAFLLTTPGSIGAARFAELSHSTKAGRIPARPKRQASRRK